MSEHKGYPQLENGRGSLRAIQVWVNDHGTESVDLVTTQLSLRGKLKWVSPIRSNSMAEYRDVGFLERVGVSDKLTVPLGTFWPSRGPQWDGLGVTEAEEVILVEAKANLKELKSPGTKAGEQSLALIRQTLDEVKDGLGIGVQFDWTKTYYQYANRVAHLYYLRELNGIKAFLINVYFIGDQSVKGPSSVAEWQIAIRRMKKMLGLDYPNILQPYMYDLFIDVQTMKGIT
ncbi:hypothetical protein [Paenibacillus sp. URB8-2]|uniref:hypothetical protein n=1 Tax=Paenibacillus sp. URB8-2 TaxID=2741301 RepID=UPI0015BF171A|nr:hypothetical protein [Paenibacillus sp. URB8-2]BCG58094.1 hypothetical protein PUR_15190 [Paenibacillus sp. URB8-2]